MYIWAALFFWHTVWSLVADAKGCNFVDADTKLQMQKGYGAKIPGSALSDTKCFSRQMLRCGVDKVNMTA